MEGVTQGQKLDKHHSEAVQPPPPEQTATYALIPHDTLAHPDDPDSFLFFGYESSDVWFRGGDCRPSGNLTHSPTEDLQYSDRLS